MKHIVAFILMFCFLISTGNQLYSQLSLLGQQKGENIPRTAVPILLVTPDARSGGLGETGVATLPHANAIHHNSAKLTFIPATYGISFSYTPWLRSLVGDMALIYFTAYAQINPKNTIAISIRSFRHGIIFFTPPAKDQSSAYDLSADIACSRKWTPHFSTGAVFRYIYSDYSAYTTTDNIGKGFAFDFSVYYCDTIAFSSKAIQYAFGTNVSNMGRKIKYPDNNEAEFLPTNLRLGAGIKYPIGEKQSIALSTDVFKLLVPTPPILNDTDNKILYGKTDDVNAFRGIIQSFYDAPGFESSILQEEFQEIIYSFGIAYQHTEYLELRTGYFNEHKNKGNRKFFTIGAGLQFRGLRFDLAYLLPVKEVNPLQHTLRFSVQFVFHKR